MNCQYLGPADNVDNLGSRSLAAYFRAAQKEGVSASIPTEPILVTDGKHEYVALHNHSQILAVYRVQNNRALRRMKRPPKCIAEILGIEGL